MIYDLQHLFHIDINFSYHFIIQMELYDREKDI